MGRFDGLIVAIKETDYIETKIKDLCEKYNYRRGDNYIQQRAWFRSYCHDTLQFIDECFETTMLAMVRCKAIIEAYKNKDDVNVELASYDIFQILCELLDVVRRMVYIKDLPSCKKLIGLSAEDIISQAKDLVKSDVVKGTIAALLLGSKVCDVFKIDDVRNFYKDELEELNSELQIKDKTPSPIEQFLFDKFNAEIGYCNLALFKTGINITRELEDLAKIAHKNIEKYESYNVNYSNTTIAS